MRRQFVFVCLVFIFAVAFNAASVAAQNNIAGALNAYRPPAPVIDVNEAAKKPVAYWTALHFHKGEPVDQVPGAPRQAVYKESEDFLVPAGMTLVIDYANVVSCFGPDEKMSIGIKTGYGEGKTPANLKILLTEQGVFNEPDGVYMHAGASQQMKIYIGGGEAFRVTAWRSGAAGHAEAEFWLSGYLMPAAFPARVQ
ncbi:MAG TPA: hypothetical protein VJ691_15040 [Vicinamibacterales bacterium]|nr:hypothetical protein [Vicinamibacterales bacterium]